MTRWARGRSSKPESHEGTSWKYLKPGKSLSFKSSKPINRDKRKEHRRIQKNRRKEANKVCFHCRMPGHGMADCPVARDDAEHVFNMCFKCGSTEHKSNLCTAKLKVGQEFAYAKCFVCGQLGHLSKACPDNPRNLYPDGGCCGICRSVEHYKKDCPDRKVRAKVSVYRLGTVTDEHSIDDEMALYEDMPVKRTIKALPKVVKF